MTSIARFEILPGENKRAKTTRETDCYHENVRSLQLYIQTCIASRIAPSLFSPRVIEQAMRMVDGHPVQKAKELAFLFARSQSQLATAIVLYAMGLVSQSPSESQATIGAEQDTAEETGSTTGPEAAPPSEKTCPIQQKSPSISHRRALQSDKRIFRATKPPAGQRSHFRLTRRNIPFGGALFVNTVCSMLALYFATRR